MIAFQTHFAAMIMTPVDRQNKTNLDGSGRESA